MRLLLFFLAVTCLISTSLPASPHEVLTPDNAAKLEGKGKTITVEFVVKSGHPVLPRGKQFRLVSEESFRDCKAFILHLAEPALMKIAAKDLERHFVGKKIRATGKVEKITFSSFEETRPGISIGDASQIMIVEKD